jgi:hypothetical protein
MNNNAPKGQSTIRKVGSFTHRLMIAFLIIFASWPLASILSIFTAQRIYTLTAPRDIPLSAALVILFAVSWVFFAFLLSMSGPLMPFAITFAIPLAYLLAGYSITGGQIVVAVVSLVLFVALARLMHRTLTPLLAIGTLALAYGLYLFPPLQPLFLNQNTAVLAWLISLCICWTALSAPFSLIVEAVFKKKPAPTPAPPITPEQKIQAQLSRRSQEADRVQIATANLSKKVE